MASQIASLIGAGLAAYLPGDNHLYKHLIGTSVSELVMQCYRSLRTSRLGRYLSQRPVREQRTYELVVHAGDGQSREIYRRLEELLLTATVQQTQKQARLRIERGGQMALRHDLKLYLNQVKQGQSVGCVEVPIPFQNHTLYVTAVSPTLRIPRFAAAGDNDEERHRADRTDLADERSTTQPPIWLSSTTATLEDMKAYLAQLVQKPRRYEMLVTDDPEIQHIYEELQEWILQRCTEKLYKGRADSKRGRLTVMPMVMNQAVETQFEKHLVKVSLGMSSRKRGKEHDTHEEDGEDEEDEDDDGYQAHDKRPSIWIVSETATIPVLQRFLFSVVNVEKPRVARQLRVHRWIVDNANSHKQKRNHARWVTEYSITNKTIQNTIVSESVEKELYEDVRKFLQAEAYYAKKGLPWKRGYFLHGPPGTGKTSLIKAIANEFNLDIFSVDMECIQNDSELIALTSMMTQMKKGKNYVVAFEDVDRSRFFKRGHCSSITKQCMLNVLDGISESYGRILFFTGNHPENVTRMPAMVRPGRIDRLVHVDFVTPKQLARMFCHFYDDLEMETFAVEHLARIEQHLRAKSQPISPAAVMECMIEHDTAWEAAYTVLLGRQLKAPAEGEDDAAIPQQDDAARRVNFDDDALNWRMRAGRLYHGRRSGKTAKLTDMERRQKHLQCQIKRADNVDTLKTQLVALDEKIEAQRAREKERKERSKERQRKEREKERRQSQKKREAERKKKEAVRMAKEIETLKKRLTQQQQRKRKREDMGGPDARAFRAAKRAKRRETVLSSVNIGPCM